MQKRRSRDGLRAASLRKFAVLALPALLSGCVTSFNLRSDTLGAPPVSPSPSLGPAPGTSQTTGGALQWQGTALGSAILAAAAVAAIAESARGSPARSSMPLMQRGAPPELDPARTIHEQDCTRPIENPSANLRCR